MSEKIENFDKPSSMGLIAPEIMIPHIIGAISIGGVSTRVFYDIGYKDAEGIAVALNEANGRSNLQKSDLVRQAKLLIALDYERPIIISAIDEDKLVQLFSRVDDSIQKKNPGGIKLGVYCLV